MTTITLGRFPLEKLAGITLTIGSLIFLIAAFMPINMVYAERNIQKQIALVQSGPTAWAIAQVLFSLGSVITVVGLVLFTRQLGSRNATILAYSALSGMVLAALCWNVIVYYRATLPPDQVFRDQTFGWLFIVFTLLTQAALIAYGFALLRAGYPPSLGWGTILLTALLCVIYIIFKDVPPFAYYVITLTLALALLF